MNMNRHNDNRQLKKLGAQNKHLSCAAGFSLRGALTAALKRGAQNR